MKRPMGTTGVVVVAEPIELRLEFADALGGRLLAEPPLLGLMEPFDLAAGLGMVRGGVSKRDPQSCELHLDGTASAASRSTGEHRGVVGEHRSREPMGGSRF